MIEHSYSCRWHVDGGNSCDCGAVKRPAAAEGPTGRPDPLRDVALALLAAAAMAAVVAILSYKAHTAHVWPGCLFGAAVAFHQTIVATGRGRRG